MVSILRCSNDPRRRRSARALHAPDPQAAAERPPAPRDSGGPRRGVAASVRRAPPTRRPNASRSRATRAWIALGRGLRLLRRCSWARLRTSPYPSAQRPAVVVGTAWLTAAGPPTAPHVSRPRLVARAPARGDRDRSVGIPVALDLRRAAESLLLSGDRAAAEPPRRRRPPRLRVSAPSRSGSPRRTAPTEEHARRVALLAVQVGEELVLSAAPPARRSRSAASLHDIGKLSVPDAILQEARPARRRRVRDRQATPGAGATSCSASSAASPTRVRRLVLDHHERLDGNGYPRGLDAAELDLDTRILTRLRRLRRARSRRASTAPAWSHEQALALLREEIGHGVRPALRRRTRAGPRA